jgi:hypothetical protein
MELPLQIGLELPDYWQEYQKYKEKQEKVEEETILIIEI